MDEQNILNLCIQTHTGSNTCSLVAQSYSNKC